MLRARPARESVVGTENPIDTAPISGGNTAAAPATDSRQRAHRSSVSSGSRLFAVAGIDGRTQTAMRFRDLVETISNDLGGPSVLSEGQKQLIRRTATLSIMAEATESDVVRNMACDLNNYGMLCDRLRRIFETLGIERKARGATDDPAAILGRIMSRHSGE
jgi:hypothetical protein